MQSENQVDTIEDTPCAQQAFSTKHTFAEVMFSKAERKRMMVREHNRAYNAGELNKSVNLTEIVRDAIGTAKKDLGI